MTGLFNFFLGAAGTILLWGAVAGAFWLFAAAILYVTGLLLPLKPRKRR